MSSKWRRTDVYATSLRRIDVSLTPFGRHVLAGEDWSSRESNLVVTKLSLPLNHCMYRKVTECINAKHWILAIHGYR